MSADDEPCARCFKPAPAEDSPELADWEALRGDDGWVCPDCITPEEQQATDEEFMDFSDEMEMRSAVNEVFGVDDD